MPKDNQTIDYRMTFNVSKDDDDEPIELDPTVGVTRVYDYLPYSQATIKNYMGQAGYRLELRRGYKEGRYPGYKQRYDVIRIATGEVVLHRVTLDNLCYVLARAGCPLPPPPRHSGAARFLKAVEGFKHTLEVE